MMSPQNLHQLLQDSQHVWQVILAVLRDPAVETVLETVLAIIPIYLMLRWRQQDRLKTVGHIGPVTVKTGSARIAGTSRLSVRARSGS
jgi:hypothetical protein